MKAEYFDKLLHGNNGIKISKDLMIFNDYELYNLTTGESKQYSNLDELLKDNEDVAHIIADAKAFYLEYDGGRGAGSGGKGEMGGGFTNAGGSGRKEEGYGKKLLNAELNYGQSKGNSIESVLGRFQKKYGDAKREYAVAVDENGYVHDHVQGGSVSVPIAGGKGQTIIHNHPSGGNFSKADLVSTASTQEKGIIATSSNTSKKSTYHFEKASHFKPKEFIKAVNKAKWPKEYSYDKGADWWLKNNASKYGYKYTSTGVPKK